MFALQVRLKRPLASPFLPCEYFDLIAGTSTGGFIAAMLGTLRMDVDTCMNAYLDMAPKIFPVEGILSRNKFGKLVKGAIGTPRFDPLELEIAIKKLVVDHLKEQAVAGEDTPFDFAAAMGDGQPQCKVFVCVTAADINKRFRFRSYQSTWEPSEGCTIRQACRATSAAPLFFPPVDIGNPPVKYVDGGLGLNNPIRALMDEASHIWPPREGHKIGCIVSVGTGVPSLMPVGDSLVPILEALKAIATDTEDAAQEFADKMAHRSGPGEPGYFRFNVEHRLQSVGLEEWRSMSQVKVATNNYLQKVKAMWIGVLPLFLGIPDEVFCSQTSLPTPDFYGRDTELEQMNNYLNREERGRAAVVLCGLSGQGKTQLALRLQRLYGHNYTSKLWVDATSPDTVLESLTEVASAIDGSNAVLKPGYDSIPHATKSKQIAAMTKSWLERKTNIGWVMTIDGVEDIDGFDIRELLPVCDHGSIIITSTRARGGFNGMHDIEVAGIDEESGVEMLLQKAKQSSRSAEGTHPIGDYPKLFESYYKELMGFKPWKSSWYYDENGTLMSAFEMLSDTLAKDNADSAKLLTLSSFLSPGEVPIAILTEVKSS
ncbi:MAG: hypothetical protein M1839_006437 [Geoglossum umbratile]|nr:MAG: hypothetical protein M1839_006437 [Geoglossum umbratile]